jgi:hypothetical protein
MIESDKVVKLMASFKDEPQVITLKGGRPMRSLFKNAKHAFWIEKIRKLTNEN